MVVFFKKKRGGSSTWVMVLSYYKYWAHLLQGRLYSKVMSKMLEEMLWLEPKMTISESYNLVGAPLFRAPNIMHGMHTIWKHGLCEGYVSHISEWRLVGKGSLSLHKSLFRSIQHQYWKCSTTRREKKRGKGIFPNRLFLA